MPYSRPAAPLEINPAFTLLPHPMVWAFGTTGSRDSFGRAQQTMETIGPSGLFSDDADSFNLAPNSNSAYLGLNSNLNDLNSNEFTRVIVFDVPADLASGAGLSVWTASREESGGYVKECLKLELRPNGELEYSFSYVASLTVFAPGVIVLGAKNRIAITRYPDNTGAISVNGGNAVTVAASGNKFSYGEMFGNLDMRSDARRGINLEMFIHDNISVSGATLKQLSENPAVVVRTVGSGAPADTEPPQITSISSNVDGTAIILTANETLKTGAVNSAGLTMTGSHTVTGITISGNTAIAAITPALAAGEAARTASYAASADGILDVAGNQLASFTGKAIGNNVGAGFWKFLGNEGATVTVAPGTRVRYGVTGNYVEKTMSGTFAITNAEFTDPAPGSIKHADAYVTTVASGYTVAGPAVGPVGESSSFQVQVDGLITGDMTVTPSAPNATFSPASVILNNTNMSAAFSMLTTAAGDYTVSFTNNKGFPNPTPLTYKSITSIFKTFGSAGDDYASLTAAIAGVGNVDPAGARIMVVLEGSADQASVTGTINPISANESYYYLIRPKKALRFDEINRNGALHESMAGATLNLSSGQLNLGGGAVIEGYKINITTAEGLKFGKGGAGPDLRLRKCFVIANADRAMTNEAYKSTAIEDTFFVRTVNTAGRFINAPWVLKLLRCTFYNKGGNTAAKAHDGGWGNGAYIKSSAYVGFGADPIDQIGGFQRNNNVSTSPMSDSGGFTVDTASAPFISSTNYRAGPALLGKGNVDDKSTKDILGNNRGLNPDAGAAQGTAALPLAEGTMTSQPDPDGARVTGFFSYTGTVDSATVELIPLVEGKGYGPLPVTFGSGTGSYTIEDVLPGEYKAHRVVLNNAGGPNVVEGAVPFEIAGVGGGPIDPGVQVAATAIVWSGPQSGSPGVESNVFNVGLDGTYSGTVRVTPSDNGQSGAFTPAFVDLVNGQAASFTYTPANTGDKTLTLANDKSLINPQAIIYKVSAPQVIVAKLSLPLTTDGTTPVADMSSLDYSWFEQAQPRNFTAPKLKGNNGMVAGGTFELILTGGTLKAGDVGYLVLTNTNGDPAQSPAALVFAGPVKVQ